LSIIKFSGGATVLLSSKENTLCFADALQLALLKTKRVFHFPKELENRVFGNCREAPPNVVWIANPTYAAPQIWG
jgi:hypothetical protein